MLLEPSFKLGILISRAFNHSPTTYLVKVDNRLPELVLRLVEIPHADFPEVTGMVFVEIGSVMMLSTSHTTTTGMLSMFAYTAAAGGDVAATVERDWISLEVTEEGCQSAMAGGEGGSLFAKEEGSSGPGRTACGFSLLE